MSLQEVENAIRVMNQAAFQELGDLFMISRNQDYSAFVCIGSQYTHKQTKSRNISAFNFSNKIFCDIYSLHISFIGSNSQRSLFDESLYASNDSLSIKVTIKPLVKTSLKVEEEQHQFTGF